MCLLSPEKVEHAEQYFVKNGKSSTFIGRLIPAVRQLISVPAGLSNMNIKDFIMYTLAGATLWNIILGIIGFFLYDVKDQIFPYLKEILIGVGVLFVVYLIYKGYRNKRKGNDKESAE